MKILVVDDEPSVREAIALMLEGPGYDVRTAANGDEALTICQTETFDLVLSDMRMPGMSGQELLGRLRELNPSQKVMLVTAYPSDTPRGFDGMIAKPFSVRELRTRVAALLTRRPASPPLCRQPDLNASPYAPKG